jgi:hypothetical protein
MTVPFALTALERHRASPPRFIVQLPRAVDWRLVNVASLVKLSRSAAAALVLSTEIFGRCKV